MARATVEKVCEWCGTRFKPNGRTHRFCSKTCQCESSKYIRLNRGKRETSIEADGWHCHDCGCPSDTYRCTRCQEKWRAKHADSFD